MVSIIIVNWNTRDLLIDCLESIRQNAPGCEVIVVDNASSDGSGDAVKEQYPQVKLIASEANLGFAAGNNLGIAEATGEYVLLLNPDTVVKPNAVDIMREFLVNNPDAGAVGCRIENPDGSQQESNWMTFPSIGWLFLKALYLDKIVRRFRKVKMEDDTPFQVAHLLGACIMAPRRILQELSGFDESYFLYLEETDLCQRIFQSGKNIYYLPTASITHFGQQSSIQAAEWTNMQLYLSTYKFIRRKNKSRAARYALQGVIALSAIVRLLLWSVRLCSGPEKRASAVRMLRGYWRLLRLVPRFEKYHTEGLSAAGLTASKSQSEAFLDSA
ncbi:MAG: glycosyltransferase family 2 protein [Armatimonadota bacterium]